MTCCGVVQDASIDGAFVCATVTATHQKRSLRPPNVVESVAVHRILGLDGLRVALQGIALPALLLKSAGLWFRSPLCCSGGAEGSYLTARTEIGDIVAALCPSTFRIVSALSFEAVGDAIAAQKLLMPRADALLAVLKSGVHPVGRALEAHSNAPAATPVSDAEPRADAAATAGTATTPPNAATSKPTPSKPGVATPPGESATSSHLPAFTAVVAVGEVALSLGRLADVETNASSVEPGAISHDAGFVSRVYSLYATDASNIVKRLQADVEGSDTDEGIGEAASEAQMLADKAARESVFGSNMELGRLWPMASVVCGLAVTNIGLKAKQRVLGTTSTSPVDLSLAFSLGSVSFASNPNSPDSRINVLSVTGSPAGAKAPSTGKPLDAEAVRHASSCAWLKASAVAKRAAREGVSEVTTLDLKVQGLFGGVELVVAPLLLFQVLAFARDSLRAATFDSARQTVADILALRAESAERWEAAHPHTAAQPATTSPVGAVAIAAAAVDAATSGRSAPRVAVSLEVDIRCTAPYCMVVPARVFQNDALVVCVDGLALTVCLPANVRGRARVRVPAPSEGTWSHMVRLPGCCRFPR